MLKKNTSTGEQENESSLRKIKKQDIDKNGNSPNRKKQQNIRTKIISQSAHLSSPKFDSKITSSSKIIQNPVISKSLYFLKKSMPEISQNQVVMKDGMTMEQWSQLKDFKIVGQSKTKKQNFNVAIDHFFNLRSMFKKINKLKLKSQANFDLEKQPANQNLSKNPKKITQIKMVKKSQPEIYEQKNSEMNKIDELKRKTKITANKNRQNVIKNELEIVEKEKIKPKKKGKN